jgi:hypothetical protein
MEFSERITKTFFRELTDLELMLGMVCLPGLMERFPRNYKLDAMCLDTCESVKKYMAADRSELLDGELGTAKKIKAREVFYIKLESLVEYLIKVEERERQAHLN